jgi:F-type H+-transporting ATPase subunit c
MAISNNPNIEKNLFRNALLGFALAEATGLLALMVAFLVLYG